MKYRVWDVEGECWIPVDQVAIRPVGDGGPYSHVLTYDEVEGKWCTETIPVIIEDGIDILDKNDLEIHVGDVLRMTARRTYRGLPREIVFTAVVEKRPGGYWYREQHPRHLSSGIEGNDWSRFQKGDIVVISNIHSKTGVPIVP